MKMKKKNKKEATKKAKNFLIGVFFICSLLVFVFAAPPYFHTSETNSYLNEDASPPFDYNLTANVTYNPGDTLTFNLINVSSSFYPGITSPSEYPWISVNSSTGILKINATHNNHSGDYNVSVQVVSGVPPQGSVSAFYYFVNATNDAPVFSNLSSLYNIVEPGTHTFSILALDEEEHYPLNFSLNFTSCNPAVWNPRYGGSDCTLFNITALSNTTFLINFTTNHSDVGEYNLTIWANDSGENYECPHIYCNETEYEQNKSTAMNVTFRVLSSFEINVSDCNNSIVDEGATLNCVVNITTRELTENLSVATDAILRNYNGGVFNKTWFYYNTSNQTSELSLISIPISVTPGRTEVGNWTINFTAIDSTGMLKDEDILIFVNKTVTGTPSLQSIPDINASINLFNSTDVVAFDSDLLIPDKNESFGGYNESITFSLELLNRSDLSVISISPSSLNITPTLDSNLLDNQTGAIIKFFFNESHPGNYTVRINATDKESHLATTSFDLNIINNTAPVWNNSKDYTINFTVQASQAENDLQSPIYLNLTDSWITDLESNELSFSATESMQYFNLTSEGILNFTPYKQDVGLNAVTIRATDSWGLVSNQIFYFNISNINSPPIITQQSNLSVNELDVVSGVMTLEIFDEDLLILDESLKENLTLNWTILDNSSQPVELFNFSFFDISDNKSIYYASNFTPTRSDLGNYTIQILVNDSSNVQDDMNFTLEIKRLYYTPEINYPEESFVFNLTENLTDSLIFNANQSGLRNLTYNFYIDGNLKGNFSSWGNGTNASWNFVPNFTDETYGNTTNLTLIVLNPYENASRNFSVNISHANAPLSFTENISNLHNETEETITIDLTQHFSDIDAFDDYYNQTVNFTIKGNTTPSNFTWELTNWTLVFSSNNTGVEKFNITAEDLNSTDNSTLTSIVSNNFTIEFEEQDTEVVPEPRPSGGGGGGAAPNTCIPSWNAEVGLCINGFRNITYWDSKKCFANFTDNASCDDPGTIFQKLVFTEELITVEHPECIEALEAVRESEVLINEGKLKEASDKLDGVVNWCRNSIAQSSEAAFTRPQEEPQRGLVWWVAVIFSVSLFLEIIYYFIYRKVKLRRIANTKI